MRGCLNERVGLTFAPHRTMPDTRRSLTESPSPAVAGTTVDAPMAPASDVKTEIGGRESGLDPTRYGDWEKNGRCIDF